MKKKIEKKIFDIFFCGSGAAVARRRRGGGAAYAGHMGKKSYLCHKLHFKCLHQSPQHFINNSMKQDQNTLN